MNRDLKHTSAGTSDQPQSFYIHKIVVLLPHTEECEFEYKIIVTFNEKKDYPMIIFNIK